MALQGLNGIVTLLDGACGSSGICVFTGGHVTTQALMIELLMAGFFSVACFRARATTSPALSGVTPRALFGLTGRLDRLRRSRWQWFCMVLLLVLVRVQLGTPLVVELTAVAEFIVFMALPAVQPNTGVARP